jgi:activator of HSP90 ATPase
VNPALFAKDHRHDPDEADRIMLQGGPMSTAIHHETVFKASPKRVFEALMDEKEHAAFTGAPATIAREAGGAFSTHGGQIVGRVVEVAPNRLIVKAWRVANWPEGVYSLVRYELKGEGGSTRLILDHTGFPDAARDPLEQGWKERYWEPLAKYLGQNNPS